MMQQFITKRDTNGNRYTLIIDHDNKTYKRDYNPYFLKGFYIEVTKKQRREIIQDLDENGYKEA